MVVALNGLVICFESKMPTDAVLKFQGKRNFKGKSDPINILSCDCSSPGTVLLFYNYLDIVDPIILASDLEKLCSDLHLYGKIRVAQEGFNVTVGGSTAAIIEFQQYFIDNNLLPGIETLNTEDMEEFKFKYFKPNTGCRHLFENLSVKVVQEICPFDIKFKPKMTPHSLKIAEFIRDKGLVHKAQNEIQPIQFLSPQEFHQELLNNSESIILDVLLINKVRNYYESQMGYFKGALCPPIRKFSYLPQILDSIPTQPEKKIITYCTGGIRCEKASRLINHTLGNQVLVLEGGIHNYLEWTKLNNVESLFLGSNYVFDARRVVQSSTECANCKICSKPCRDYTKCVQIACHLIVPCCDDCRDGLVKCCPDCLGDNNCTCEIERRLKLSKLVKS